MSIQSLSPAPAGRRRRSTPRKSRRPSATCICNFDNQLVHMSLDVDASAYPRLGPARQRARGMGRLALAAALVAFLAGCSSGSGTGTATPGAAVVLSQSHDTFTTSSTKEYQIAWDAGPSCPDPFQIVVFTRFGSNDYVIDNVVHAAGRLGSGDRAAAHVPITASGADVTYGMAIHTATGKTCPGWTIWLYPAHPTYLPTPT